MTLTIWKFPVPFEENITISMPAGAIPLTAAVQGSQGIQLWVEVETDADTVDRLFWLVGTGAEIPVPATKYISTVQVGMLVFHLYSDD